MKRLLLIWAAMAGLPACEDKQDPVRLAVPACRPPDIAQGILSIGASSFEPYQVQAAAVTDATGRPALSLRLDRDGAAQLERITAGHLGEVLPLRVDDEVLMSPRVMETISRGEILVAGNFEMEELEAIARRLSPPCDEAHP